MPASPRRPHFTRGTFEAAMATGIALLAHLLGGGDMPGLQGVAVPLVLSLILCINLRGSALSIPRLAIAVAASQTLFHTLFVLGTPPLAPTTHAGHHAGIPAGHAHEMALTGAQQASAQMLPLAHAGTGMWLSHLAAAAITLAVLYRSEQVVLRLRTLGEQMLGWVRRQIALPRPRPVPHAPTTTARLIDTALWSVLSQLTTSALRRRGPPACPRMAH